MAFTRCIQRRPPLRRPRPLIALIVCVTSVLLWWNAAPVWADGGELFLQHCSGCHVNGGNIIRRGKTLRLVALERQGLDSREAITRITSGGIGQMRGYGEQLGEQGVTEVADWVWQQAQLGWPKPA